MTGIAPRRFRGHRPPKPGEGDASSSSAAAPPASPPDTLPVVPPPANVADHLFWGHAVRGLLLHSEAHHDQLHESGQADHVHGRSES